MRGFLTSYVKDFTTRAQLILRKGLLSLGTVKQKKALKERLGAEVVTVESQVVSSWKITGKERTKVGLLLTPLEVRKRGPWKQDQGYSPGLAAAVHCSPGRKSPGHL